MYITVQIKKTIYLIRCSTEHYKQYNKVEVRARQCNINQDTIMCNKEQFIIVQYCKVPLKQYKMVKWTSEYYSKVYCRIIRYNTIQYNTISREPPTSVKCFHREDFFAADAIPSIQDILLLVILICSRQLLTACTSINSPQAGDLLTMRWNHSL